MKTIFKTAMYSLVLCCINVATQQADAQTTTDTTPAKLIRVAIYDHSTDGPSKGCKNLTAFLTPENGFVATTVTPEDIRTGALANEDLLIMPGGSGSKQAKNLGEDGKQKIREFVAAGKGYMGICAGSYLATNHYKWSLGLINAQVLDTKHWARGTGTVTLNLTELGQNKLAYNQPTCEVYYGQGPLLAPGNSPDMPKYEIMATYASEIAKNGAPQGVMIGTTAIARTQYDKGRVICFSPHPERPDGLNFLIINAARWAARQ
jgi:glutamine amidotransferase-like uncharacterized protein